MIATANIEQAMIDRLTEYFTTAPKPYPTKPIINNPDISKAKAEGAASCRAFSYSKNPSKTPAR
ncbi:MAG: hypothetical protein ORN98_06425 [Alphaproteobacteria bacterium]|nr:hypothetical protein [Alphaproteobacteria bacterium]